MDENRRGFLKKAGYTALGLGCGFPLLATSYPFTDEEPADEPSSGIQYAMVVDFQKCLKKEVREACITACKLAHNIPTESSPERRIEWMWEDDFDHAFPDQTHAQSGPGVKDAKVLLLCNHCSEPACVKVCPTGATWKRKQDGIVMMDMHRCIGCRYCIAACPYGARSFNWRDPRRHLAEPLASEFPTRTKGVVEKCNFCAARLRDALEPACVVAAREVPGGEGALTFGDLSDKNSDVSRLLHDNHTICRRPSIGAGPNVFYIV